MKRLPSTSTGTVRSTSSSGLLALGDGRTVGCRGRAGEQRLVDLVLDPLGGVVHRGEVVGGKDAMYAGIVVCDTGDLELRQGTQQAHDGPTRQGPRDELADRLS